ncbi:hypothetical protein BJY24_007393 [Nocardia transvalensis]|uniref:Prenyltransferase/squalene oxidase-like repeat protein n=1 Tax=Nocardia transvalensis TaxID=37333 RepID=A0A7W9UMC7_9NOCA|nr:prenyltransferase/squalene oxidase repeat-containing protein [Nocardia transvalensis]MBB5918481.1 hypothetical protein [Nocardia transvalensis]
MTMRVARATDLDGRIGAAVDWLYSHQRQDGRDGAGWGWISDVSPNPVSTAEVVCALALAGREIPRARQVALLMRGNDSGTVVSDLLSPLEVAWRLRGLQCLGVGADDPDAVAFRRALLAAQDADSGGWPMTDRSGPVSITATAVAIQALGAAAKSDAIAMEAVLWGAGRLVSAVLDRAPRKQRLFESACVVATLAHPQVAEIGGDRFVHARELALCRLITALRRGGIRIEEESFRRGGAADTWRHLTLHATLCAVTAGDPQAVGDPVVQQALTSLLELQEREPLHAQYGGFRTSPEGYVTSSATAQALEAMIRVRAQLDGTDEGTTVFEPIGRALWSRRNGVPRPKGAWAAASPYGGRPDVSVWVSNGSAGVTISVLAVIFADQLGRMGSRALVAWGLAFVAIGTYEGLSNRLPQTSRRRIAAAVLGTYTALLLPLMAFLLT